MAASPASAPSAQVQLTLHQSLERVHRHNVSPDRPQPVRGPIPPLARFNSLLYRVANGEVYTSPARKGQAVAVYGLSHAQVQLGRFMMNRLDMSNIASIAVYNHQLGIVHYSRADSQDGESPRSLIQAFSGHISAAASGELASRVAQPTAPILKAWVAYLGANHQRLDPFARLHSLLAAVPPADRPGVVTSFVLKNTSGDCHTESLVNRLLDLVGPLGCNNAGDVNAILDSLNLTPHEMLDLSELFIKHFFRNSSKLGLEFFAKQGAEIVFAWNDASPGKMDMESIRQKPWQENLRRFQTGHEPITYSEIRSVQRHPELFDGKVSRAYFDRDGLELADALGSDDWVKLANPTQCDESVMPGSANT
ncbi:hypothetical protein [Paludibacterium paludis]|uniref:Uncharacterized protein n=1 Tax=Paludibacterium paludis TaxID=1225769 RepID=A0A918P538_9NEIS|nr:hypothetical protein [Paludibacterium paludis]GGY24050.1 hypothetical protein GCM10011289_29730 [Paludibacterium paludis]